MKRIVVFLTGTGWVADFVGDEEVRSLFGTTVIPTPFTVYAEPEMVLRNIRTKNPECLVEMR